MQSRSRLSGFTLVELMAVVAIVAVLATVAVFSYKRYLRRARVQEGVAFLMDVKLKQETYFMTYSQYVDTGADETGFYPPDGAFLPDRLPVPWNISWNCSDAGLTVTQSGFCALGLIPPGPDTWFQYVTVGWAPGDVPPAGYGLDPSRRWWLVRGRTFFDSAGTLPLELRLTNGPNEIIEIWPD